LFVTRVLGHSQHTMLVCWGGGLNKYQPAAGDGKQRPLVPRVRFQPHLMRGVRLPLCKLCTAGDLSRADGSRMMSHGRLLSDTDLTLGKSWNEKEEIVAQESGDL
jgi:hypothetical protein